MEPYPVGPSSSTAQSDLHKKKMPLITTYNSDDEDDLDDFEDLAPLVCSLLMMSSLIPILTNALLCLILPVFIFSYALSKGF